jgi:thioesterase domain-containing protein
LIGYSLGGLVTLEMAQRLSQQGEKIALLAMLESYPYVRFLPPLQRQILRIRRAKQNISTAIRLPIREALAYIALPSSRRFYLSWNGTGSPPDRLAISGSVGPTLQRARDRAFLALTRYRPRFYAGKIKFVRAETASNFPDDPAAIWANLAGVFEVETVPGDHLGIIAIHSERLAAVLSRYLNEAFCLKGAKR